MLTVSSLLLLSLIVRPKCYDYSYRPTVNIQHSTGWHHLQKVNKWSGVHFQTLFCKILLFLMFLNIQIDLIISKTDYEQFTLTTKNHCISPLTADFTEISSEAVLRMKAVLLSQQPHHTTTVLRPIFRTTRVSRCHKRTSGLYGARED